MVQFDFCSLQSNNLCTKIFSQLAVEYESNALIVKVDTDDEYEFARDMQVISCFLFSNFAVAIGCIEISVSRTW